MPWQEGPRPGTIHPSGVPGDDSARKRTMRLAARKSGSLASSELGRRGGDRGFALRISVLGFALSVSLGCAQREPEAADGGATVHDTALLLEPCDGDAAERYDADEDGKPEVVIFKRGKKELCRKLDFDDDGSTDRTTFLDKRGKVRRIESDFDRDRRVDEIAVYQSGVLKEKHRATVLRGQLDTWEYYQHGVRVRSERDADGDGVVDQWWDYRRPDCPLIHSDVNGDGLADPGSTIDYCREVGQDGFKESAPGSGKAEPGKAAGATP